MKTTVSHLLFRNRSTRVLLMIATVAILAIVTVGNAVGQEEANAQDWTQWRGPQRDGMVENETLSSADSLAGLKEQWHVDLGPSYSSPIVVGDMVFVTETKDKQSEVVRALNRETGEQLWETEWQGAMTVPFFAKANGDWIRATPVYDNGHLYVSGMTDVLVCLKAEDGSKLWEIDFKEGTGKPPSFGAVCSPLIHGDFLYIEAGNGLRKINKLSGDIEWTALKAEASAKMSDGTFSSPLIATVAGREQILVQTRSTLAGVDLDSGDVLWSQEVPAYRGMNILTPTVFNDSVFTSSYNNGSYMYKVSAEENSMTSSKAWQGPERGYMSSPIRIDNHVYLHLQNTRLACIDLETGETKWKSKQYGKYWSMICSGDRILALDERGELLLVRANPEKFDLLDRKEVSEESTWAHVALSGNQIFVRELNGLTLYDWNTEE